MLKGEERKRESPKSGGLGGVYKGQLVDGLTLGCILGKEEGSWRGTRLG